MSRTTKIALYSHLKKKDLLVNVNINITNMPANAVAVTVAIAANNNIEDIIVFTLFLNGQYKNTKEKAVKYRIDCTEGFPIDMRLM